MPIKYRIEIIPFAWKDLKKIEDYYIIQFDVETAIKVSDHILDVIERNEDFPDPNSLTPDKWLNRQGYRMVVAKKQTKVNVAATLAFCACDIVKM